MLYERILQQSAPVMLLMLGVLMLAGARPLRAETFLGWIAAAFLLIGGGLSLQSFMTDDTLTSTAPLVAVMYLGGALATVQGVGLRCGDGPLRNQIMIGVTAACLAGSAWFSYVQPDLLLRMINLNLGLWLVYMSQVPWLLRRWNSLSGWNRTLGATMVLIAFYHFLRAVSLGVSAILAEDAAAALRDLTMSLQWQLMLVASSGISLWTAFIALLCAAHDRIEEIRRERDRDPLTGLLNRRAFFEQAREHVESAPHLTWVVIAGDIDFFKNINDMWSHPVGDEALVRIAGVLQKGAGPRTLVARFGGEEFILLLGCQTLEAARAIAEKKREMVALTMVPGLPVRVTMSFGVAPLCREPGLDLATALGQAIAVADGCLYKAKAAGRNQVVTATSLSQLPAAPMAGGAELARGW